MQVTAETMLLIKRTSSNLDKQRILSKHIADRRLKTILKFIYNPYFKTGISDAKLDAAPYYSGYPVPESPEEIMQYLVDHPTGDKETCGIANTWMLNQPTAECRWLARGIITQDMQIGVTATTLNKVYGSDFIPKLSCMLGTPLDKIPVARQRWPYVVTEKLDGVRRIMVKQGGKVRIFSRSGHEDTGLVDIVAEAKYLPDNYAYDGELLAVGTFKDSIAQRQATNSLANKKGEKHGLTFNIFDMVPTQEFLSGRCTENTLTRKTRLAATLDDPTGAFTCPDTVDYFMYRAAMADGFKHKLIKPVPILGIAHCMEDVEPIVNALWAKGKEGVMLNDSKAIYESKRTKSLVKMKQTHTYVLRIEAFAEGTGKYEDMLGALVTEYKDCYLQVGSGFTDYERYKIWANQDKYIGALFEVEAFGESTNKQGLVSLNCPIFKRIVALPDDEGFKTLGAK